MIKLNTSTKQIQRYDLFDIHKCRCMYVYEKVLLRVLMKVRDLKEKIEKYQDGCNKELFVNDMTLIRVNVERMEKDVVCG